MKSRFLKSSLSIFIILLSLVTFIVRPIYMRLVSEISRYFDAYLALVTEKTELSISYKSLSPSILTRLRLKGIEVYDKKNNLLILSIDKVDFSYSFAEIFKRNLFSSFNGLAISGVTFVYNEDYTLKKIQDVIKLFQKQIDEKENVDEQTNNFIEQEAIEKKSIENSLESEDFNEDSLLSSISNITTKIIKWIPFTITIKDIQLKFVGELFDADAFLQKIVLNKSENGISLRGKSSGYVDCLFNKKAKAVTAGIGFSFDGDLFPNIVDSAVRFHVYPMKRYDLTLGKNDFLFHCAEKSIVIRSLQRSIPFSFFAEYEYNIKKAKLISNANNFCIFDFLIMRNKNNNLGDILNNLRISGDYSVEYDLGKKLLSYVAKGSASLYLDKISKDFAASYNLNGNLSRLNIKNLDVKSDFLDVSYEGLFDIKHLQPSGTGSLNFLKLNNGAIVSGDLYFDPYKSGFMCFSPQISLGERALLTAVQATIIPQKNSIDFNLEVSDYSHFDYEEPALLTVDGSFLLGKNAFLQSRFSFSNIFIDSVLNIVAVFVNDTVAEKLDTMKSKFSSYILSNEIFVSSDLKTFSYNMPYAVLANIGRDKEVLLFSVDGNENTIQVSKFDLIYGSQTVNLTAQADLSGSILKKDIGDVYFSSQLVVNSMPYSITGSLMDKTWLSIIGDYDLEAMFSLESPLSGTLHMQNFPLVVQNIMMSISLDTSFFTSVSDGLSVALDKAEVSFVSNNSTLSFSGMFDKYGLMVNNLSYSDATSSLDGNALFMWTIENGIFNSMDVSCNLQSTITKESINVSGNITNPQKISFSSEALKKDFYFSIEANISSILASHFLKQQKITDTINGNLSLSGTIENPFVSLNMDNTSITLLAKPFVMSGAIIYDTDTLNLVAFEGNWFGFSMTDTTAEISLRDFSGKANTRLETKLLSNTITVPLKFSLASSASQNGKIPDIIGLEAVADGVTTSAFEGAKTVAFNIIKSPGRLDIMSNDDLGLTAYRLDDGEISVKMSDKSSVRFDMFGYIRDGQMQLAVDNTHIDMSKVSWIFNTNMFSLYKGIVTGDFGISGLISDPEFSGKLLVDNIELSSPSFVPYHASAPYVYANLDRNEISISESLFTFPKKGALDAAITLVLDRWKLDHVDVKLRSPEDNIIPVDVKIPFVHAKGGGKGNLDLTISMDSVEITGDLYVEDTSVELVTSILQAIWLGSEAETVMPTGLADGDNQTNVKSPLDVRVAIDFTIGSHVQIYYNPLLRGLVEPNSKFSFGFDSATGATEVEGDVSLRGGEVMYFNRNFYLKEGRIVFDKNNSLDPKLTVRAETRERDSNNELVIITLTALNQSFSNFTARLSASPAKSEAEIMNMLGQIVTADSGSAGQFAGSVLDYGMQMTVFRKFENALRDLFNFDIFSIRVSAVQNAIAQSVNQKSTDNEYTVGNFFDNSSVYIGKYFGSSLYVDSLMRLSYDETKVADGTSSTGLIFQPEIGFELQAPFANIRWDIAPDVSTNQSLLLSSLWVQATSITLSWKIDF